MYFLNSGAGYILFSKLARSDFYVDKTMMIDVLYRYSRQCGKYICVTRPRRFGKSAAAEMISAFFDESTREKSRKLFEGMKLGSLKKEQEEIWAEDPKKAEKMGLCWTVQGRLKVIHLNMIHMLSDTIHSYAEFRSYLDFLLREDLQQLYPDMEMNPEKGIAELLVQTGSSFAFVIDEWDAVLEARYMTAEDRKNYMDFLRYLLKDRSYVDFAYMTGVLPIAKYSSSSSLNMFHEFSAFEDDVFYSYFGLSLEEIQGLMEREGLTAPSLEELALWYDGYTRSYDGVHMLNPESVSCALADGECGPYWTMTGPRDEVEDILRYNLQDVREDVLRMAGGETLSSLLMGFAAENEEDVYTKDEIFSAMVVYGYLSYAEGQLRIPNHELMLKFKQALTSFRWS